MISKADFNGSPHLGIFCAVNDNIALVPHAATKKFTNFLKESLEVDIVKTNIVDTQLIGIFICLNNSTAVVPDILEKQEIRTIKDNVSEVVVLKEKYTALGNLISLNDKAAICSRYIQNAGDIAGHKMRVANTDLVGSAIYANNLGFIAHRDASPKELKEIESVLGVKGDVATLNFGDPFIKSGIIGNSRGVVIGKFSSGPEVQRVDEVFMLK